MNRIHQSIFACLLLLSGVGIAQEQRQAIFDHSLQLFSTQRPIPPARTTALVAPETLRILCAMVEFQEDNDGRTSGNGKFDLSDTLQKVIDPPPHNKSYFGQHLTFASNYFRKASDGKFIVTGEVLDDVYTLPRKMQEYSPPRSSSDNSLLGWLMHETWRVVDSVTPGIQYQNYDAFIIFHAGVGRDVAADIQELDPTPFDVPSIYLGLSSLQTIFGSSYQGVPVADSAMFISNSMILPETESRKLSSIVGSYLLQLSINGLLVANIGSHIGLPDLFDTETGRTGIGRFGLMDGQSIFSWFGVFPPEPSAWEKQYLGWVNPITVTSGAATYELPAVSLNNSSDSIYKAPISAKEYFLIENRNRDANRDGVTITTIVNGDTLYKTWYKDTTNFNAFDIDSIYGNVIDVDEFDWSLPGGVSRNDELFDGGVLVWHIDENIIDANLSSNSINADINHRGVDIEEADGSQDIGQSYEFLESGSGSEDGTALDFWYAGNSAPARRNANRFTPTTFPNSNSYQGANSHIYLKDFSTRSPRMTVTIQVGDENIKVREGFPKHIGAISGNSSFHASTSNSLNTTIALSTDSSIVAWNVNADAPVFPGGDANGVIVTTSTFCNDGFEGTLVLHDVDGDNIPEIIQSENQCNRPLNEIGSLVSFWSFKDTNSDTQADKLKDFIIDYRKTTTSPVASDSFVTFGLTDGNVSFNKTDGTHYEVSVTSDTSVKITGVNLLEQPDKFIVTLSNGDIVVMNNAEILARKNFPVEYSSAAIAGTISSNMGKRIVVSGKQGAVYLLNEDLAVVPGFPFSTGGEIRNAPALADVDQDGQRDIIVFSGKSIWVMNSTGAVLDNFPIVVKTEHSLLTSPVVADMDGDGDVDVVAVTQEGLVVAYSRTGAMATGFPLQVGNNTGSTPVVFGFREAFCGISVGFAVASSDGNMYALRTGYVGCSPVDEQYPWLAPWPQYMHDAQNTGLVEDAIALNPRSNEFLPPTLAYNWPNPVRAEHNYKTHIRYFVSENANVTIKILDIAGDLVATLTGQGIGGFDNEVEWDVSNIESGIYFAHIEATGATKNGVAIIKIAVVK